MISQKTAGEIWEAYREIKASEKLLADIQAERASDRHADVAFSPTLKDVFGRRKDFQLGVPSGQDGHRIFNLSPDLAETVIRSHMAKKLAELTELNERARLELDVSAPTHDPTI